MKRTVSFCFDDGFRRSAEKIRDVFSRRKLSACFAVLSRPLEALDPFVQGADLGDWSLWRETVQAGHEVAPHGLVHERYGELTLEATKASVLNALDIMEAEIPSFRRERSMFHVPYLTAPEGTVAWLATQSLGVRLALDRRGLNAWSELQPNGRVDSVCYGPDRVAESVAERLDQFRHQEGWLVVAMHGIDGEGWGAVSRSALEQLVDDVLDSGAEIAPPNKVLSDLFPPRSKPWLCQ